MKRLMLVAAALALVGCALLERIPCVGLGCAPIPAPSPVEASPEPEPTPKPIPSVLPPASPEPEPTPKPSPIPTVAPPPSPEPCASPAPPCEKPAGCVSCAAYMADAIRSGELIREGRLVYNLIHGGTAREYFDPQTCNTVWPDGSLRNRRLYKDGTICPACPDVPTPAPCPSPTPRPSPSNSPSPQSSPWAFPETESGNISSADLVSLCRTGFSPTHEVGISVLSQRECSGEPNCRVVNLHATEKSVKPFCEHSCYDEQGRYSLANCRNTCETLRECQQPEFVNGNTGVKLEIKHPDWQNEWGDCDKRTAECEFPDCRRNFICHDRVVNRNGTTTARACMPDGTKCGPVKGY